jgi:hypothetical protein
MTISLNVEIPESLHQELKRYIAAHPNTDQDQAIICGLSLLLSREAQVAA